MMQLISWNVNRRVKDAEPQAKGILRRSPDVVALQELMPNAVETWRKLLASKGYTLVSAACLHAKKGTEIEKRYGVVGIASRWPVEGAELLQDIPFPELVMTARILSPSGPIEVTIAHAPNGGVYGWQKVETFQGIYRRLACAAECPRILCGDFNSPDREGADGTTVCYTDSNPAWHDAEYSVIRGLEEYDLRDAYRRLHGYRGKAWSYTDPRLDRLRPHRFDHTFSSTSLEPVVCEYMHRFRRAGLSDHAPMRTIFAS